MESTVFAAFSDELNEIAKQAGLKEVLLSDIPGTKDWIVGPMRKAMQMGGGPFGGESVAQAAKAVTRPRAAQAANGAWDVSRQAAQMGL